MQPVLSDENDFDFTVIASFYKQRARDFFLEFDVNLKSAKEFECSLTYVFLFATTEDINEKFINSHFPIVNAPAIAFPYIRSFLSNLSLNAGYLPSILPSINFTKLDTDKINVFVDGILIEKAGDPPKLLS